MCICVFVTRISNDFETTLELLILGWENIYDLDKTQKSPDILFTTRKLSFHVYIHDI